MAQAARIHEAPPQSGETGISADHAAMLTAAKLRKLRIHDNIIYCWVPGHGLAALPTVPGFAGLPAAFQPFALMCFVQGWVNRVGQSLNGKSANDALRGTLAGDFPKAKDSDAFYDAFYDYVEKAIAAQYGELPEKPKNPGKKASTDEKMAYAAKKAEYDEIAGKRAATIEATAAKYLPKAEGGREGAVSKSGANLWDEAISVAIAAGERSAAARETKRAAASAKTEGAADL